MEQDALLGRQLGAYLIQGKLGEGGMARVYKAYHARLRRDVAIKVISSHMAKHPEFQARFEQEAQLIARLEHRNIVAVYDFGEAGNLTYLVMQYVGGGTLRDQLHDGRPLEPYRAAHYALQMASALHHAHSHGIVHRDVKPQNMLVSANNPDLLLLSDFGIAKIFESKSSPPQRIIPSGGTLTDPSLTSFDQIIGTAEYMAPEQINRQPIDARTDVYALGVVLYQMLAGHLPFQPTTAQGFLYQHVHTLPKPVREINPNVSEALAHITAIALAKAPEARFPSADAMAQALERAITPPTSQYPLTPYTTSDHSLGERSLPFPSGHTTPTYIPTSPTQPPTRPAASFSTAINTPVPPTISTRTFPRQHLRPIETIVSIVLILIALILVVSRVLPSFQDTHPATASFLPFTENFQNNNHHWPLGSNGGLTESLQNNQYTLTATDQNTYFPHPDPEGTVNGPLPQNFTLTADIQSSTSDTQPSYGLVFRFQQDNSGVHCYAFVINGQSAYAVLKYDPHAENGYSTLQQGQFTHIDAKVNILQVTVHQNKFSFKINQQVLLVNSPSQSNTTLTDADHPYTGGQLGLLVAGPNTTLIVTKIQSTIL